MKTNLKLVRTITGKSQEDVAKELGVALSTYQKYEQGQRKLTGDTLIQLARIFGTTTDTILGSQFSELKTETLMPDEARLLSAYRSFDASQQEAVLTLIEVFADVDH